MPKTPAEPRRSSHRAATHLPEPPSAEALDWDKDLRDWPALVWPEEPIRPAAPSRRSLFEIRALAAVGTVAIGVFFVWLFAPAHRGDHWLFWPLALSIAYNAVWWMMEWSSYIRPRFEPFVAARRAWTVDVLTTACPGEPRGMVLRTLRAMQAIRYPHTSYLCDEGNDPALREACRQLGIVHVTRADQRDAKAGNINHALAQATGEIAVVLDPDHEPSPYFLDRVLGYFEDPAIGFVQSVQAYRNAQDSFVADGAAKQTYLFYGPIMIGLHAYGVTQAVGANCVFRRAALDSIGGHAAGLSEDMHTTLRLYARRWRSVYVPEVLTRGLVPSTLGGYCKQQAKWACGSLDLLLRVYPRVFRQLTGWQKLHYFFAPLYFLRGLVGLIDLLVPIACLTLGGVALRIDSASFLGLYLPAFLLSTLMRQVAQRWAIEPSERGTHLAGAILGFGCWWTFLRGTLCALSGRRLPYIPTEKASEARDCWKLITPNLFAIAASLGAIVYGLGRDWSPFNFTMAAFALWNSLQLAIVSAAGQQRTLRRLAESVGRDGFLGRGVRALKRRIVQTHCAITTGLRHYACLVALPVVGFAFLEDLHRHRALPPETAEGLWRDPGGFYLGSASAEEAPAGASWRLLPSALKWGEELPAAAWRQAAARGQVPLIDWQPPTPAGDRTALCPAILHGDYDRNLAAFAEQLRVFGEPVLIRFAPQPNDPAQPWSEPAGNSPEQYRDAWVHVVSLLNRAGATNAGWIWSPGSAEDFERYYPGDNYVDWIGLTPSSTHELAEQYLPLRPAIRAHHLPVLLSDFGSDDASWLTRSFAAVARDFEEIRGLVLREASGPAVSAGLALPRLRAVPPAPLTASTGAWREQPRAPYRSPFISGTPGHYELTVDGRPFYIHGVTYNPGHDWRDGNQPLTRRELETDFASVRRMGANTIRRYGGGWADRNIFNVAAENDLQVLYGFWFEQELDYASDAPRLRREEQEIEQAVLAWKDRPNLLGWSLGNEVWGLLKHHYAQPYLTQVRHAHVDFVEHLARRIHELDPRHPVFIAHEHSPELAGTLSDFAWGAPSLDFTGVNSYYEHRISELREIAQEFDPRRPYLISEFGTDGYWDPYMTRHGAGGAPLEPSSGDKIASYERAWSIHTEPNRGANIGAVAYCWRNRLESTATWFGLNDAHGLPKPSYFALQRLWHGATTAEPPRLTAVEGGGFEGLPGSTIEVRAAATAPAGSALHYEWRLGSRDFDFTVGRVESYEGGSRVRITLPRELGLYRVYVNVNDGQAADEANFPIVVRATLTGRP